MKEIPFPDGVIPLEIFVGSVGKERTVDTVDGRPGVVDYGFNYTDRPVSLFLRIKAADAADFRLLRNEVFTTFDVGSAFYVAEADVPSRALKVVVDESYIPDRLTEEYADFDINCRTLDSVFWESKYTTLELHDSGYSATAEKYGLVDNIDDEKVQYRFIPETDYQPNLISLTQSAWEVGNWYTTNGTAGSQTGNIRTKSGQIPLVKGEKYTLKDSSVYSSAVRVIFILHYNNGVYVGSTGGWEVVNRDGSTTFTAKGNEIRISIAPMEGFSVILEFITNGRVQLKLEPGEEHTGFIPAASRFSVYNAGNVTVEPESMRITFNFTGVYTTGGFTIRNLTTGEEVILNRSSNGSHFKMDGMTFSLGAINNVFRYTNRRFISLAPGDNQFEIVGGTFSQCWFDFRYYFK